ESKTVNEEEDMAAELEELFPSFLSDDFADIQQQATLEQIPVKRKKTEKESIIGLVTPDVMDYICQLHSHVVQMYTNSAWLLPALASSKYLHTSPDFIKPLMERFKTFCLLMDKLSGSLSGLIDMKLYPSLSFLVSVALN
ncbi:hypothetical protein L9F63_024837, partial [Diploptera punctata]